MTKDDVLFGYRQQLFAEAARTNVSAACRTFGVHRSTYYAWKRQVDRHGLEMLRPRERRRPQMPNALPKMIEERIVSFSLAHPGLGPKRVASELAREKWGAIVVSPNGVWKVLCRHGLNTRAKRLGLIAGYAAPYEPPRDPGPEQHIDVDRPGELVGIDCFYVGRLRGTEGAIWQLTAIDIASSFAWAELVVAKKGNPTARQTSTFARRVAVELKTAGWALERLLSDNGNEFKGDFTTPSPSSTLATRASTPVAHRPTGTSKHYTKRSSTNAGAPPSRATSTHASAACAANSTATCTSTTTTASTTAASPAAASPQTSSTVPARWRTDEPHLSAHPGVRPA
jgi:transposase